MSHGSVPKLPLINAASSSQGKHSPKGNSARGSARSQLVTAGGTIMSATRTKYTLTPRATADGEVKRLTPRDMQGINAYITANKKLNHTHRAGKVTALIPDACFAKVQDSADVGLGLSIAPVHPKESALDIPLRFAPPADFHCPTMMEPRQGTTMSTRVVQLLKGTSTVPQHWQGERDGQERDIAHTNVIRDLELRAGVAKRAGNIRSEGITHLSLGSLFYNAGALEKATQHFLLACNLFEQAGDPSATGLCHNLCGVCYYKLGSYKMALIHHKKQEELSASYGRCVAQTNMGICYTALGEPKYAEQALEDALTNAIDSKDDVLLTIALGNAGLASMRVGDMRKAQSHLEQCLEHCSIAGDKVGAAVCLLLLGEVYTQVNDFQHAQFYYEHSFRVADDCGCRDVADIARVSIGVARGNQQVKDNMVATAKRMGAKFGVRDVVL